ncbi:hypothetical protein [Aromatoleum buckelii]|uniref:Uncharacterized protein n=1 Tax=Aromatoleum buckelii TaxID=200254 RepID=A0ABX1MX65_9RHOO|nr:hypothetical protein [Aromatoleum buckelii]MCK0510450.1 hypothetical protein [Aromatoleum buckelii]
MAEFLIEEDVFGTPGDLAISARKIEGDEFGEGFFACSGPNRAVRKQHRHQDQRSPGIVAGEEMPAAWHDNLTSERRVAGAPVQAFPAPEVQNGGKFLVERRCGVCSLHDECHMAFSRF